MFLCIYVYGDENKDIYIDSMSVYHCTYKCLSE